MSPMARRTAIAGMRDVGRNRKGISTKEERRRISTKPMKKTKCFCRTMRRERMEERSCATLVRWAIETK